MRMGPREVAKRPDGTAFDRGPAGLLTVGCATSGYNRAIRSYANNCYDCPAIRSKVDRKSASLQPNIDNRMITIAVTAMVPTDGPGLASTGRMWVRRLDTCLGFMTPLMFGRMAARRISATGR